MDSSYILEKVNTFIGKDLEVTQEGFMEAKYVLEKIKFNELEDILTIYGENNNKIIFNLNMVSKIEDEKNSITMYLDNDCIIKLKALN